MFSWRQAGNRVRKRLADWLSSRVTRVLLILFFVLVIAAVFIGLQITTGFIICYLAVIVLTIELTRRWRRVRNFIILGLVAFFGSVFLAFLHQEVVFPLAGFIGGTTVVDSTPLQLYHDITSGIILFFGPVGILVGFFGSIILVVWRLIGLAARDT
jgi:hypothetical protein